MNRLLNYLSLKDERGVSLLELIAAMAISSIIVIAGYGLLMSGMKTAERVKAESILRDEADLIVGNIIESFYLTKASTVQEDIDDTNNKQLVLKDKKIIGFDRANPHLYYSIADGEQKKNQIINQQVEIDSSTKITKITQKSDKRNDFRYEIDLTLTMGDHTLNSKSAISLINDKLLHVSN